MIQKVGLQKPRPHSNLLSNVICIYIYICVCTQYWIIGTKVLLFVLGFGLHGLQLLLQLWFEGSCSWGCKQTAPISTCPNLPSVSAHNPMPLNPKKPKHRRHSSTACRWKVIRASRTRGVLRRATAQTTSGTEQLGADEEGSSL